MAKTFEFTAPNGKTYEVSAPDGATSEQAFAVLQQQLGLQTAPKPAPKPDTTLAQDIGQGASDLAHGLMAGASNVGRGVLALPSYIGLPKIGGEQWHKDSEAATKEMMKDRGALGSVGEFASEMAGTAGFGGPVAKVLGKGASVLPKALGWASRSPVVAAAAEGAAAGGVLGQGDWHDVGVGAAGGAVGQKVLGGAAKILSQPAKQTAQADALRKMGIEVTAGQGAQGNSIVKSLEEAAQYVPGAANSVRTQREVPYDQIRKKVMGEIQPPENALQAGSPRMKAPEGEPMDRVLKETHGEFSKQYDNVLQGKTFQPDQQFQKIIADIHLSPKYAMSESNRGIVARFVHDNLEGAKQGGQWTGEALSVVRRNLDAKAASSTNPEVAQAFKDASEQVLEMMTRQSPEVGQIHKVLQAPYRNLVTADEAAKHAINQGEFGVGGLARAGETTNNPGMRDFGRMAATVLKDDINRGGTGVRTALGLGALGLGYAGGGTTGAAGTAALPAALYLGLGTRGGQRAMSGQLASQKKLAEFLRKHPTAGSTAGANIAVDSFGE